MAKASFLLEHWSAIRLFRRLRRPLPAVAVVLALTCSMALTAAGNGTGVNKGYSLLVWSEFLLILVVTLVESSTRSPRSVDRGPGRRSD